MNLIRELNRNFNQTFVIVTHSLKLAQSLDRVIQLAEGATRIVDREVIL